ncbi:glycosyl hydrolase family 2 [Rathayibacter sp. PhB93]|uniref:glycoside hydrolase family 2 TIM barrel-domain containing protein n=1 Tax=unclassified Rathayibacter TaxID=2609250 RepID=UPI000F46170F|nr:MULTISPECIES: glycoside hydrolase family 2 TIM barrel-domain containing protein [unclassified Rathayibacter]ROQ04633.1 glycosyl hydrolase family 2 [Rathayibacter sp. PhB93]TDQ13471.1 glycosyl hydrolase family 2 [Rathayibacter sp. PhB1]
MFPQSPLLETPPTSRTTRARTRRLSVAAVVALAAALLSPIIAGAPAIAAEAAPTFAAEYLDGVSGPQSAREVDLAGTWDFTPLTNTICTGGGIYGTTTGPFVSCVDSPAPGGKTTIAVPGGGWHKQGWTDLSRATYSKTIQIPKITGEQVTRLNFGAINHRATVAVDGRVVGTQTTSYTSSVFDLSDFVKPGSSHLIEVTVEGRKALIASDMRYLVPEGASWSDDVAQGIFRSATLEVLPAVFVADTVVRTSVSDKTFSYDTYVTNSTDRAKTVLVRGTLDSANEKDFAYPRLPLSTKLIPANSTEKITVGPLRWKAGTDSYWTPNVPYQEDYAAQLHDLKVQVVSLGAGPRLVNSEYKVRFGFRQLEQVGDHYELNGTRVNFRGDSLQGANYDNIDNSGVGDAYDTLPGFLEPSAGNGGWREAVRNYQRLNYNVVRIHQIPATPYMLDVADELGLMIMDETAIRGSNNRENFTEGRDNMVSHLADLVTRDRNHASVVRWSQANEPQMPFFTNPGQGPEFDELLYQTVMALDSTRPISTDGDSPDLPHDNYTVFCHYEGDSGQFAIGQYTENVCELPGKPNGQTEFIWNNDHTPQGMTWFATATLRMREKGADDTRPYTLLSNWSSVIPGVKTTDFTSLERGYPDGVLPLFGEDNLPDPWDNEQIQLLQKAFNPVAVVDTEFWNANKLSDENGTWPVVASELVKGSRATRTFSVFNDTLSGTGLTVTWALRGGSASGSVLASGKADLNVPLGTVQQMPVSFTVPDTGTVFLELSVTKGGKELYRDASTRFDVTSGD